MMKKQIKINNALYNWYYWLVETNDNKFIKWYTKVFSDKPKN